MRKDWISANSQELMAQIDRFAAAFSTASTQAAAGLSAAQVTALTGARTTLNTTLTNRATAQSALDAAQQSVKLAQADAERLLRAAGRTAGNAAGMTDALRGQAGLSIRGLATGQGELPTVTNLVVLPRPSGANFLDWSGPTGGSLLYDIYTRPTATGEWTLVGSATATDFLHRDAGAGVTRHYKIVPRRGQREGESSNEAIAYG